MKTTCIVILFLSISVRIYSQWQYVNTVATSDLPDIEITSSNTIYACALWEVIKSTNGGLNWYSLLKTDSSSFPFFVDIEFLNANTGYAFTYSHHYFSTSNGGSNWLVKSLPSTYNSILKAKLVDSNTIYITDHGAVIKTSNKGLNWLQVGLASSYNNALYFVNKDTGYYAGIIGGGSGSLSVIKTCDGFRTAFTERWYYIGGSSEYPMDMSFFNEKIGYFTSLYGAIYRTRSGSFEWGEYSIFFPGFTCAGVFALSADTAFAVADHGRIIRTTNCGISWELMTSSTGITLFEIDFYERNFSLVSGSGGNIVRTTNAGIIGFNNSNNEVPVTYKLYQNYPNPFNPLTIINYEIPKRSYVRLFIYDITGKEVAKLTDIVYEAGKYEAVWDAGKYSSGVYIYRLITEEFTDSKKMILIR